MTHLKAWLRFLFAFSRTETNGFLVLIPIMFLILFSQPLYHAWFAGKEKNNDEDQKQLDSLVASWQWEEKKDSTKEIPFKLFRFNPNVISENEFNLLGLNPFTSKKIIKYRLAGGTFKIKKDLLKIYGLDSAWFKSRYAYIDLPELAEFKKTAIQKEQAQNFKVKSEVVRFNLNEADTTQLIAIYGIGPKLAQRILKYRDKLGGYITMNQLSEVYGLDSAVVARIREKSFIADQFVPTQLKLNHSTEQEFAVHPYLSKEIARAITTYRFQHGAFASLDELNNIKLLDEKKLLRMKPYFTLD
jgi:competence protein ComEA